jgi:hypothetical protein
MIEASKLTQLTQKWIGSLVLFGLVAASAVVLLVLVLVDPSAETAATTSKPKAAVAEAIEGSDVKKLTFTEKAVERLDIQVAEVADNAIPYAAVLYGLDGETFVYTNPEPLVYIRAPIVVDHIEGDQAILADGPPAGTSVVTVGGAELIGLEFGLGK